MPRERASVQALLARLKRQGVSGLTPPGQRLVRHRVVRQGTVSSTKQEQSLRGSQSGHVGDLGGCAKGISSVIIGGGVSAPVIGTMRGRYERLSSHTSACGTGQRWVTGSSKLDIRPLPRCKGRGFEAQARYPRTCKTRQSLDRCAPLRSRTSRPSFMGTTPTPPRASRRRAGVFVSRS
jgi:hypothetical protein